MDQMTRSGDEEHDAVAPLMPWHATGRLDAADRARVDAHLAGCARCRATLSDERALLAAIRAEPEAVPEPDWSALERRLGASGVRVDERAGPAAPRRAPRKEQPQGGAVAIGRREPLRWVIGAQFAALALLASYTVTHVSPLAPPAPYHVLGSSVKPASGNVLAMFRPDATEASIRRALTEGGARVVDGPTSGDAYVLMVAGGATPARLAALRRDPAVAMAEPISMPVSE